MSVRVNVDHLTSIIDRGRQSRMIKPGDLVKYEPDSNVVAAWYGVGLVLSKDVSEPPFQTVSVLWSGPKAPVRLTRELSVEKLRRYNDV